MKIAICGKGGSGKSSFVALLANGLHRRGYQVLVVDSDESNPGLHRILGFDARPEPLLDLVGGKKNVFRTFSEHEAPSRSILTQDIIETADLPPAFLVRQDGIGLVSIGKIHQSLEGCACPMGALSREFLNRLRLQADEIVLVDTEAGVEHFGRGVETGVDTVLAVTEPSYDSLELAVTINSLANELNMENTWAVLSKVPSKELDSRLRQKLEGQGVHIIGSIPYDPEIFLAGLEGRPIHSSETESSIEKILDQLLQGV